MADDSKASNVGGRYAQALFDLANDEKKLAAVEADLRSLKKMRAESADFRTLLASPAFSAEQKGRAVAALADKARFNGTTRKFLGLLAANGRIGALPSIITSFETLSAQARGVVSAQVTTALPLTAAQSKGVAAALRTDPLQIEPILDTLVRLDWVARLDEQGAQRHVLLAEPAHTPAAPLIDKMVQAKQAQDLHTGTLTQLITYEMVRDGVFLDQHIQTLRATYRRRRDLMLRMLEENFPQEVTWTKPDGGLFLMITLPQGMDASELLKQATARDVAFVPGDGFFTREDGHNTFRLNYSNAREDRIEEGIRRLGVVLKEALQRR